jgi:hypothetical protein
MNENQQAVQDFISRLFGFAPVTFTYDTSTSGNIEDAIKRAEFFGKSAIFWMEQAILVDAPNGEQFAAMDARLAFQYAKVAYALQNERFDYLVANQPVPTTTPDNTPREVSGTGEDVSGGGLGQDQA